MTDAAIKNLIELTAVKTVDTAIEKVLRISREDRTKDIALALRKHEDDCPARENMLVTKRLVAAVIVITTIISSVMGIVFGLLEHLGRR